MSQNCPEKGRYMGRHQLFLKTIMYQYPEWVATFFLVSRSHGPPWECISILIIEKLQSITNRLIAP